MSHTLHHQLVQIISSDIGMLNTLRTIKNLKLPDCWIGAGFVRNAVWDYLHDQNQSTLTDIDVIYFNPKNTSQTSDRTIEEQLNRITPQLNWSVKNQARMHIRNGHPPYLDCNDAISYWPETATSIAIRLTSNNKIEYLAPYGLDDLFNLIVRHSHKSNIDSFEARMTAKKWKEKWIKLKYK